MTEEIIIDCAFYKDGVCASPINKTCEYCKNIDVSKCYHKQLKRLEQENKELESRINEQWKLLEQCGINSGGELRRAGYIINDFVQLSNKYRSALEEINRVVKLAHKVDDYLLGQDYTDLVDRIEKELEVLQ